MNIYKIILTGLFFLSVFSCCNKVENSEYKKGRIEEGVYKNDYFGLKVPITNNWKAQSHEKNKKLIENAIKVISNGDEDTRKNAYELMESNAILLNLLNINDSTSIVVGVENVNNPLRPKNAKKYFIELKSLLNHSSLKYKYLNKEIKEKRLNNIEWHILETIYYSGSNKMKKHQDFYVINKRDILLLLLVLIF